MTQPRLSAWLLSLLLAAPGPAARADLFVSSLLTDAALEYDGTTGAFVTSFASGSGASNRPARHEAIPSARTDNRCTRSRQRDRTMPIPSHSKEAPMRRTGRILLAIALGVGVLDATRPAARADLTIFMSATGDRIDQVTPPDPRSQFAQLPFGTNPEGVVFDVLGNLFVAGGQDVFEVTPGGDVSHFATLPFSAGGYGIAIDSASNLYVADSFLSEVSKIDPSGTVTTYATLPGLTPTSLAFDAIGNLYVTANGTIQRVAPGGGTATTYVTLPLGFNNNHGLAFDSGGNLYASDVGKSTILKIAPDGSISTFATLLSGGSGLTFDGHGNLYVTEVFANQIEVIRPNGDTSLFATQLDNPRFIAIRPAAVPEPSSVGNADHRSGVAPRLPPTPCFCPAPQNDAEAASRRAPHRELPELP